MGSIKFRDLTSSRMGRNNLPDLGYPLEVPTGTINRKMSDCDFPNTVCCCDCRAVVRKRGYLNFQLRRRLLIPGFFSHGPKQSFVRTWLRPNKGIYNCNLIFIRFKIRTSQRMAEEYKMQKSTPVSPVLYSSGRG